jgi:hypothetical protein
MPGNRTATLLLALVACAPGLPSGKELDPAGGLREVSGRDAELELAPGAAARLPDLGVAVRFDSVVSDSRCPADVTCVWAGDGAVQLSVTVPDGERAIELHTTIEPRSARAGGVVVDLLRLTPTPRSDRPSNPDQYRVRLRVRAG